MAAGSSRVPAAILPACASEAAHLQCKVWPRHMGPTQNPSHTPGKPNRAPSGSCARSPIAAASASIWRSCGRPGRGARTVGGGEGGGGRGVVSRPAPAEPSSRGRCCGARRCWRSAHGKAPGWWQGGRRARRRKGEMRSPQGCAGAGATAACARGFQGTPRAHTRPVARAVASKCAPGTTGQCIVRRRPPTG
jgi:hypothetical protein